MTHLSSDQLIEAADGTAGTRIATHLELCAECREAVTELRAVLSDVGVTATVPDPSPLFWEHFSRRVHEATVAEAIPARPAWWQNAWRPLAAAGALAAAVALAVVLRGPSIVVTPQTANDATTANEPAVADDMSVDVMSAVAGDLSFEELRAADLVPNRAAVDVAVSSLSEAQQRELMRLVREQIIGSE